MMRALATVSAMRAPITVSAIVSFDFRPANGGKLCQGHSAEFRYCHAPVSM